MKRPGRRMRRYPIGRKPYQPRNDPVTQDVYDDVMRRDGGRCVGPRAGLPGGCGGRLELDHILNGGLGRRGPSSRENLCALCRDHHRWKTEHANDVRPRLVAWVFDIGGVRSSQP